MRVEIAQLRQQLARALKRVSQLAKEDEKLQAAQAIPQRKYSFENFFR
ncbi:MAG: hypothetical protein QXT05_02790 [Candidatus Bilamarchaeaceae archaeon]